MRCKRCGGAGYVSVAANDPLSVPGQRDLIDCPDCAGTGVEPPEAQELTKARMLKQQASRDNAPPTNSPPNVARLYR